MERKIDIDGQKVSCTFKRNPRSKALRISVYPDGTISVSAPRWLSVSRIEQFIAEKSEWIVQKLRLLEEKNKNPLFRKSSREEYEKYKKQAKKLAAWKLRMFNEAYGFDYKKISIRNQKTLWGSCSGKGTLSYNYKIALLPERHADYIIVHELCHLKEFNHSKRFWELVSKTVPDYKAIRKELKKG